MKFKVESIIEDLLPWELVIEHDGVEWVTRRPDVGALLRLASPRMLSDEQAQALAGQIFESPPPQLTLWPREAVAAAVSAYMAYFQAVSSKNASTIAGRAKAAVEKHVG